MKIGFIGLGIMGKPMAKNLLKAGFEVVAYTHKQATIDELVSCGAEAGTSGADLAGRCDAIVTMLPNSPKGGSYSYQTYQSARTLSSSS